MRLFLGIISILFHAPISYGKEYQEAGASRDIVYYNGNITVAGVERFKSEISNGATTLVITSGGGDEIASLDMAEEIQRRDMTVVVRGYCMSGCANAVFIAAKKRILLDGAVIGLHGSAIANRDSYLHLGEPPPAQIIQSSQRYESLYESQGISIRLLQCASINIGQTTKFVEVPNPLTGEKARGWISRRSLWAPSDRALRRFGLTLERVGSWPETDTQRDNFLASAGLKISAGVVWGEGSDCR